MANECLTTGVDFRQYFKRPEMVKNEESGEML
jgi:hypothetical protein